MDLFSSKPSRSGQRFFDFFVSSREPTRSPRESKAGKLLVKIFAESENLKSSAKHFRVKQRLQGAFLGSLECCFRKKFGNNSGEKMILVGDRTLNGPGCLGG